MKIAHLRVISIGVVMMPVFEYSVWFRDETQLPEDEDYEWPALFLIQADTAAAALEWGDHLAHDYAARMEQIFLRASVGLPASADFSRHTAQIIPYGATDVDAKIGW